jgi:hypothetical protein
MTVHSHFADYRLHGSNSTQMYEVSSSRLSKYLNADQQRINILKKHCDQRGIDFGGQQVLRRWLPYREVEVMVAKIEERLPRDWCRSVGLALMAVRAGFYFPQSIWQRALRSSWILAVGVLPLRFARPVINLRYDSRSRPRIIERLVRLCDRAGRAS